MSTSHRFHLIGIGGAGMSVVAELLKDRGLEVSGSDQKESPILDHLRDAGIEVFVGHDAAHVPADAVVVVSTAGASRGPSTWTKRYSPFPGSGPGCKRYAFCGSCGSAREDDDFRDALDGPA